MADSARRQFVDDVLGRRVPGAAGQTEAVDHSASEMARPGTGQDYMLELRFKSGRSVFLDYTYLPRCDYDPQTGIRLRFSTCDVRIEGTNLRGLVDEICARKRRVVEEDTKASRLVKLIDAAAAPFVSKIVIDEEKSDGSQQSGGSER